MTQAPQSKLDRALATALAQYAETMGEAFPIVPKLDVVTDSDFWAVAEMMDDTFHIRVSAGTATATTALWTAALADSAFVSGLGNTDDVNVEDLTHAGLVWLFLHEMHHFQMGHFSIVGRSFLSETFGGQRSSKPQPILLSLNPADLPRVEPCLEMQADHEAIEMLLDAYSPDAWPSLRARACAIAGMMILIEREDAKDAQGHATHPKTATRIFQLLGHLIDMPTIQERLTAQHPALGIDPFIPTEEEQTAFVTDVVVPIFFDAASVARIAAAQAISDDLGSATDFFHDVQVAKLADSTALDQLVTVGAKQWAELVLLNSQILATLEWH